MPTTMKGVFYMPSDQELNCDRNIARWKRDLHLVKRLYESFASTLTGHGYRNDAEYQEANRLTGIRQNLERSIKNEQERKKKWSTQNRKRAARVLL